MRWQARSSDGKIVASRTHDHGEPLSMEGGDAREAGRYALMECLEGYNSTSYA